MNLRPILIWAALLCPLASLANEFNYQDILIGEKALGMAGAYTALSDDPTGSYYNPAGLATSFSSSISASLNVYGFEWRNVSHGYVTPLGSANLSSTSYPTVPTTFGIMRKLGPRLYEDGPKQHAVAFSMLVPSNMDFSMDGEILKQEDTNTFDVSQKHRTLWAGPSYAYLISPEWAVGMSAFLTFYTASRRYGTTDFTEDPNPGMGYVEWGESKLNLTHYGLTFRVGGIYQPTPNWRVGLTVGTPWISLYGEGNLKVKIATGRRFGDSNDFVEIHNSSFNLKDVTYVEPLEIRAGAAYIMGDLTIAADISYHHSEDYKPYTPPKSESSSDMYLPLDPFLWETVVKRKPVVNANLGWEYIIAEEWPLRQGFYTNFSSAPDVKSSNTPGPTQIDSIGSTLSIGYITKGYNFNIGVQGSLGMGSTYRTDPFGDNAFASTDATEHLVYFFISGAQRAVAKTVEGWIKKETTPPKPSQTAAPEIKVESQKPEGKAPKNEQESSKDSPTK